MTDWGQLYRDNVEAVSALAGDLSAEQRSTRVPATPDWTVHDLVAHLAGGAADAVAGRMDDAPASAWSDRHVGERTGKPIDTLIAELGGNQDAIAKYAAGAETPAIVWDIAVHHADLHEALGLSAPPEHFWSPVLEAVAARMLDRAEVRVRSGDQTWGDGDGEVEVAPYELFRSLFSRRSRSQMKEWGAALGTEQLDGVCIFGPREDDQPVPA